MIVAPSFFFYLPNDWPPLPSSPTAMHRLVGGHQTYPSSSQDVHHSHRPNPTHSQTMFGPNQLVAASNARRIQHPPTTYIRCDTGMFAGRTIRAEAIEVQKANVGRKCVFYHPSSVTSLGLSHFHFLDLNTIRPLCRYAASKDRRALDPPPVTKLRIYDVRDSGNGIPQETEVDYR